MGWRWRGIGDKNEPVEETASVRGKGIARGGRRDEMKSLEEKERVFIIETIKGTNLFYRNFFSFSFVSKKDNLHRHWAQRQTGTKEMRDSSETQKLRKLTRQNVNTHKTQRQCQWQCGWQNVNTKSVVLKYVQAQYERRTNKYSSLNINQFV